MSGAEAIAGLVLAALPLVIKVLDNYERTFEPYLRYRRFAPELDRFEKRLKTQKTIFRNECRLLLSSLMGRHEADQMLEQRLAHPSWKDKELDQKLLDHLGSSADACVSIVSSIEEMLGQLEKQNQDFQAILSQEGPGSIGDISRLRRVREKLKFCFSKSKLNYCVDQLRCLNNDFINISKQIVRLETNDAQPSSYALAATDGTVVKFQTVQKASQELYDALANACTVHTEHSAHLCLETKTSHLHGTVSPRVRFRMAYTYWPLARSATVAEPVWLSIESIISYAEDGASSSEMTVPARHLVDLTKSLKRQGDQSLDIPSHPVSKRTKGTRVSFAPLPTAKVVEEPEQAAESIKLSLPDLCSRRNFCVQIQSSSRNPPPDGCIGFLDKTSSCKHLVYYPQPDTNLSKRSISLAKVISTLSEGTGATGGMAQWERLRLAKSLATAVLQFHATPWLRRSWRSQDVVFFGLDRADLEQQSPLTTPHLVARLSPTSANEIPTQKSPAPNIFLFHLGVILLELALQAPLLSLQRPEDLDNDQDSRYTEFYAARRLSKTLGSTLGATYGRIVRKCLTCDFGRGHDLTNLELQARFYQEVVCELENLEQGFRKLHLGY